MQVMCPSCGGQHEPIEFESYGVTHNIVPCPMKESNGSIFAKSTVTSRALVMLNRVFIGGCQMGCMLAVDGKCRYLNEDIMPGKHRLDKCPYLEVLG